MQVQTEHYRQLLTQLNAYCTLSGYRPMGLSGAIEFLHCMEQAGVLTLEQITTAHIKAHYAYLHTRPGREGTPLSVHTIPGYLYDIRLLLRWAELTGRITISPMAGMRFATPPLNERDILSREEVQMLYDNCITPLERLTLGLYYGCGLRASEGALLNLGDVDTKSRLLYVRRGKGRKRRVIPLPQSIMEDVANYVHYQRSQQITRRTTGSHTQALALNKAGTRMQAAAYRKVFRALLQRCETVNQAVSLHHLRHSIATHLLADGMRIERVRDFLGHECIETTQRYTRVNTLEL